MTTIIINIEKTNSGAALIPDAFIEEMLEQYPDEDIEIRIDGEKIESPKTRASLSKSLSQRRSHSARFGSRRH